MISIVILTLNEEINIGKAIESVRWSDDVVVVDSYSTDRTVEIAESLGARVRQRVFDNYAAQRNYSLKDIEFKYSWVLMLDADEYVPIELAEEMLHAVRTTGPNVSVFRMRRKDFFFDEWIKRSSGYPTWFSRLVRPQEVTVTRAINEEYHTNGDVKELGEHLLHYPFSKGVSWWVSRHNRYSDLEADRFSEYREGWEIARLFSRDPTIRRKHLKALGYNLPFRPILVFCYLYFARGGILDGVPGFYFAALRASYELMIDVKCAEKNYRES